MWSVEYGGVYGVPWSLINNLKFYIFYKQELIKTSIRDTQNPIQ